MLRPRRLSALIALIALATTIPGIGHADPSAPGIRRPCDSLDQTLCLLPFPNDYFTRPDPSTPTGLRVDILPVEMPRVGGVKPIDPTEWNRQDGFSPGSAILTNVPGVDLHQTWGTTAISTGGPNDPADNNADISRYARSDAPILLIDAQTGQRLPFWSEIDTDVVTIEDGTPAQDVVRGQTTTTHLLIIRPAVNFPEGHTILVALRDMRDANGNLIAASPEFQAYRDATPAPANDLTFDESRRAEITSTIDAIRAAELARGNSFNRRALYLSWRFTIASEKNLSERVLHMRDDALALLGDTTPGDGITQGVPPQFTITGVTDITNDPTKQRQVDGTIRVPNYLDGPAQWTGPEYLPVDTPLGNPNQALTGRRLLYGLDGLPMQNPAFPWIDVPFVCTIPRVSTGTDPANPMIYGHGLLGSRYESAGGSTERDRERNFMPCATNWMGFADYDFVNAVAALSDPSNMPTVGDRAQQGFVNFIYLERALAHPDGLAGNPAFEDEHGSPLFKPDMPGEDNLVYDGNSQGGIMGGALCALSVDLRRCVLGVTGMNYSTLLNRSVDWEGGLVSYSTTMYSTFPDKPTQQLVEELVQMLWDRAEADGYAEHMTTDPYPDTPPHQVLMDVAVGDFQVTNWSAEVEARTIGARLLSTSIPVRFWERNFAWGNGLAPYSGNTGGSAFVWWDSGNLPPPDANAPPNPSGQTDDPHEDPRRDPRAADQKAEFWTTGVINDVMASSAHPYGTCRPGEAGNIPRAPQQNFEDDWCTPTTLASYGF